MFLKYISMKFLQSIKLFKRYFYSNSYMNQTKNELLAQYYYSDSITEDLSQVSPGIVVCFDGHIQHGGLADRLRGIVSVYSWCREHNVPFYINYTSPLELTNWLVPNEYDWFLPASHLSYNSKIALPFVMIGWDNVEEVHAMLSFLHFIHPKKQLHIYCNSNPKKDSFHLLFKELFKLEDSLAKRLEVLQEHLFCDTSFVGMSFRFNQLLGDFKDTIGTPLNEEEQQTLINKCIEEVDRLHRQNHPNSRVLITADSTKFIKKIAKFLDYVAIIPGKSVHMDQMRNEAKEAYTKVFIDMFMLSRATKVYLLCTGKMYRGAFGEYASLIGSIPYEVDEF